tara:strand:- start:2990 stop:3298 length:309 start_codon:yes stop_codon:yes gene_type:complete
MPWFIKTERFKPETLNLSSKERQVFLARHKSWVTQLTKLGNKVSSGYLVNEKGIPGGGGFLILQANSYAEAISLIKNDPMIINDLVNWNLEEWVPVVGELIN